MATNYHATLIVCIFLLLNSNFTNWRASANVNIFKTGEDEQFLGKDASGEVFGKDSNDVFPVAYYDINSDKLTDLITVSKDRTSINVFVAYRDPPYLRRAFNSQIIVDANVEERRIVSVRPGDFTGDGVADLMITLAKDTFAGYGGIDTSSVELLFCLIRFPWGPGPGPGNTGNFQCGGPGSGGKLRGLVQEPTVLDVDGDMVLDLIGEIWVRPKTNGSMWEKQRQVWISKGTKASFEWDQKPFPVLKKGDTDDTVAKLRNMLNTSSNAYADIDGDGIPELLILTQEDPPPNKTNEKIYFLETFEIVKDTKLKASFRFKEPPVHIETPPNPDETQVLGQPIIIDFEHRGKLSYLLPYCTDSHCSRTSGIYVIEGNQAIPLPLGPMMYEGTPWGFIPPHSSLSIESFYSRTVSFRVGDYNLDGFPDLLGVLKTAHAGQANWLTRAVLFENVPCKSTESYFCNHTRTFFPNFNIFKNFKNVISSTFYDISDDGVLDAFLVSVERKSPQNFVIDAFKNEMNFDSSFLKVMVLIGQQCLRCESGIPYGNVLPGATVKYTSLNSQGLEEKGIVSQTYRTSHMPLDLPCQIFGIGHSPNFIERLEVIIGPQTETGVNIKPYQRTWLQIIPNSQVVVVPLPVEVPGRWIMKLFLTPSDVVLKTFGILVAICAIFGTFVGALEFKERREDRLVRQSEAHRLVMY